MSIQQAYVVDGKIFNTKQEAADYVRIPKVKEALNMLTAKNAELVTFLMEKEDEICNIYDSGKIKRVTKQERKALSKALDHVAGVKGAEFLTDNYQAVLDSFRWPSVKRGSTEEIAERVRKEMADLCEGNEEMVKWMLANKEQLLAAYEAGVEKREVNQSAVDSLAAYQAAKKAGPEALAAYRAEQDAKKAAKAAAKAA
jgi:hypothetical protein